MAHFPLLEKEGSLAPHLKLGRTEGFLRKKSQPQMNAD
jgi:hypothetical protein